MPYSSSSFPTSRIRPSGRMHLLAVLILSGLADLLSVHHARRHGFRRCQPRALEHGPEGYIRDLLPVRQTAPSVRRWRVGRGIRPRRRVTRHQFGGLSTWHGPLLIPPPELLHRGGVQRAASEPGRPIQRRSGSTGPSSLGCHRRAGPPAATGSPGSTSVDTRRRTGPSGE